MEKILLVDEVTKEIMVQNPRKTKVLEEDFNIKSLNDIKNSSDDYFIKIYSGNDKGKILILKDMKETNEAKYLCPSELFKNTYYCIEDFYSQYKDDLKEIFEEFAYKAGAKEFRLEYIITEETKSRSKIGSGIGAEAGYKDNKIGGESKNQATNDEYTKTSYSHKTTHMDMKGKAVSKEEMRQWINDKGINLEALPSFLKTLIKEFLDRGSLSGKKTDTVEIGETIRKNNAFLSKLSVNANIPIIKLQASFKKYTESSDNKESIKNVSVCYCVTF